MCRPAVGDEGASDQGAYIAVIAPSSYEFIVAFFAILAAGEAAVLIRERSYCGVIIIADGLPELLGPDAVYLTYRAFYWSGGLRNLTAAILAGVCTEIKTQGATPEWLWHRLRQGPAVAFLICQSLMWTQMKQFYDDQLGHQPPSTRMPFEDGVRRLRLAKSDSGALTPEVKRFWGKLLGGRSIGVNYAATEFSIATSRTHETDDDLVDELNYAPTPRRPTDGLLPSA